ncbi:MAG: DUF4339 domain-containing protein [Planctomycetales bacterium]|nr:DUF4339 domain-containing protein [Planctomycetales bacterium]
METTWYYSRDGRPVGPISGSELVRLSEAGQLVAEDLVWREGMDHWTTAGAIGLGQGATSPAPVSSEPIPPPPPAPPPLLPSVSQSWPTPASQSTPEASHSSGMNRPPSERQRSQRRSDKSSTRMLLTGWLLGVATMLIVMLAFQFGRQSRGREQGLVAGRPEVAAKTPANVRERPVHGASQGSPGMKARPVAPAADSVAGGAVVPEVGQRAEQLRQQPVTATVLAEPDVTAVAMPTPAAAVAPVAAGTDHGELSHGSPTAPGRVAAPPTTTNLPSPNSTVPATGDVPSKQPWPAEPLQLFQEVDIHRRPTFMLPGIEIVQDIRYVVLSRLHLGAVDGDGNREVTQYIEGTRLLKADDLSRATFAKSLESLQRQQFVFTLTKDREVVDFRGHEDNRKLVPVEVAAERGVMVTSVIDLDGWRELAEYAFFRPATGRQSWKRKMTHDWGALGSWSGETTFLFNSPDVDGDIMPVQFQHNMKHSPPRDGKPASLGMGMQLDRAEFRAMETSGAIRFNVLRQRVESVREQFAVQGRIQASMLGQPVTVDLTEQQVIGIQLSDDNPWQR